MEEPALEGEVSGVVTTTHYLKAADGIQLSLTLHLSDGLPKSRRIPTLLQITPYQPIDQALSRFGSYRDYHFFVLRGAAYVEADGAEPAAAMVASTSAGAPTEPTPRSLPSGYAANRGATVAS